MARGNDDAERVTAERPKRDTPYPGRERPRRPMHSSFGIASVAIGAIVIVLEVAMVVVYLAAGLPADVAAADRSDPLVALIACSQWGGLGLCVLALVLGIAGLLQPSQSKAFPILGLGLNLAVLTMACATFALNYVLPALRR